MGLLGWEGSAFPQSLPPYCLFRFTPGISDAGIEDLTVVFPTTQYAGMQCALNGAYVTSDSMLGSGAGPFLLSPLLEGHLGINNSARI